MKTHLRTALLLVCVWTSAASQEKWQDYCDLYFLDSVDVNDYDGFRYFQLEPADYWKYLDTSRCSAHWWPSDSLYKNRDAVANMTELYLQNDSIHFRTAQSFGEQYEFFGKFRMPATQFRDHVGEPVLDGILLLYKRGILFQRLRVSFKYELAGD